MNRIKEIAGTNKIKIRELIVRTSLSKSYLYDIMNDKSIPTITVARKIAKVLNSDIDIVFPEQTEVR